MAWPSTWRVCVAVAETDFLGHCISTASVAPLRDNVQVILDLPTPTDCKTIQQFLAMVNFYCHFFPGVERILQPLTASRYHKSSHLAANHVYRIHRSQGGPVRHSTTASPPAPLSSPLPSNRCLRHPRQNSPPATGRSTLAANRFLQQKLSETEVNYSDCLQLFQVFKTSAPASRADPPVYRLTTNH
jgi:hypothetical protein